MKISWKSPNKIRKLQMHENVNENMFSFTFLYKFSLSFYEWQLKQHLIFPWSLINLKLKSSSLRLHQVFPTLMVQILFSQIQQVPDFRKVGKFLHADNLCKQIGFRSDRTEHLAWSGSKLFDNLMVFPKVFWKREIENKIWVDTTFPGICDSEPI